MSDEKEHSEREFYYSDEYEFLDTLEYSTPVKAGVLISISRGFFSGNSHSPRKRT